MKSILLFLLVLAFAIPARAHEESAANEMATAANNLIASFTGQQKAASVFAMNDDHRLDCHFVPKERKGTTLKDMTPQQRRLMTALLA
jgi:predicted Zn-dependent protease